MSACCHIWADLGAFRNHPKNCVPVFERCLPLSISGWPAGQFDFSFDCPAWPAAIRVPPVDPISNSPPGRRSPCWKNSGFARQACRPLRKWFRPAQASR